MKEIAKLAYEHESHVRSCVICKANVEQAERDGVMRNLLRDAVEYIDKHPGCILSGPDHGVHRE